jgi:RNA polymerase sigma-70 factor (ECF subfamily)
MDKREMVEIFLRAAPPQSLRQLSTLEEIGGFLHKHVVDATAAWPTLEVPPARFLAYIAERLPADGAEKLLREQLAGPDLYLACACAAGNERALAAFDSVIMSAAQPALIRMGLPQWVRADVMQQVREKLFVGDHAGRPRIASYAGRGSLTNWVRATVVRTALNFIRNEAVAAGRDDAGMLELPVPSLGPEQRCVKKQLSAEFNSALSDALRALPARQRLILKQHYFDGVSVSKLAGLHGVHSVTALRWIHDARANLLVETRRRLRSALDISEDEIISIARVVESRLHVTFSTRTMRQSD